MNSFDPYPLTSGDPRAEAGRFNQLPQGKDYLLLSYSGTISASQWFRLSASALAGDAGLLSGDAFTCRRAGLYDLQWVFSFGGGGVVAGRGCRLKPSRIIGPATSFDGFEIYTNASANDYSASGSLVYPLEKGDSVRLEFYTTTPEAIRYAYLSVAQR
jgi:hypothetical protein